MDNNFVEKNEVNAMEQSTQISEEQTPITKPKKRGKKILIICISVLLVVAAVLVAGYYIMMPSVDDITGVWVGEAYSETLGVTVTNYLVFDEVDSGMMVTFRGSGAQPYSTDTGEFEIDGYSVILYDDSSHTYRGSMWSFEYNPFTKELTNGAITYTREMTSLSELYD